MDPISVLLRVTVHRDWLDVCALEECRGDAQTLFTDIRPSCNHVKVEVAFNKDSLIADRGSFFMLT